MQYNYERNRINKERERQISLGYDEAHDNKHDFSQVSDAAACYCLRGYWRVPHRLFNIQMLWPFKDETGFDSILNLTDKEKVELRIKELSKAGALIAAEIDRYQRIKELI